VLKVAVRETFHPVAARRGIRAGPESTFVWYELGTDHVMRIFCKQLLANAQTVRSRNELYCEVV
jgi:hypothetical protein